MDTEGIYEVIWPRRLYLEGVAIRIEAGMLAGRHILHVEEAIDILEDAGIYRFRGQKFDGAFLDRVLYGKTPEKESPVRKRLSAHLQEGVRGK